MFVGASAVAVVAAGGIATLIGKRGRRVKEIRVDLGRNIVDTARDSGVPEFAVQKVNTTILYSVSAIPPELPVRFARSGLEVTWEPVFGLSLFANEANQSLTETISLSLRDVLKTDIAAHAFVEQTIGQFQKGKWRRYYDPTWETLLTGRSSFLDQQGKITSPASTIDPAYKIEASDWLTLVGGGAMWRWVGDGVLARLSVDADRGTGTAPPTYRIDLDFDLLDVKLRQDEDNAAERRKEGDAKGQNATADYERSKKDRLEILKALEANALKRGDSVVVPH